MIITCRELTEMVTDHKEGRLRFSGRAGVAVHLSWCARCRTYARQMDLAIETVGRLADPAPPAELRSGLRERFRAAQRGS